MYERGLSGHVISDRKELERCKALFQELTATKGGSGKDSFDRQATLERQKEIITIPCDAVGIAANESSIYFNNKVVLHFSASRNAFVIQDKGIKVGSEVLVGNTKTKAIVEGFHWSYDLIVRFHDTSRKVKVMRKSPREVQLAPDSQNLSDLEPIPMLIKQTIVLEGIGRSWKAYFDFDPDTKGFGRSESEAVGSLYIQKIGTAIMRNPQRFGLTIVTKPTQEN